MKGDKDSSKTNEDLGSESIEGSLFQRTTQEPLTSNIKAACERYTYMLATAAWVSTF